MPVIAAARISTTPTPRFNASPADGREPSQPRALPAASANAPYTPAWVPAMIAPSTSACCHTGP